MNWLGLVLIILIVVTIVLTLITNKRNVKRLRVELEKVKDDLLFKEDECELLKSKMREVGLNER